MAKSTKVIHRKLGREKVWGFAHICFDTIELDSRLKGRRHLLYLIHEMLHILEPTWSETKIKKASTKITDLLWEQKYRKVDLR